MMFKKYFQSRSGESKAESTQSSNPPERISLATPPICHRVPGQAGLSQARDLAESAVDLARSGFLGTAVERIEEQLRRYPDDYQLLMELAEVHALHCRNLLTAEKIVTRIENSYLYDHDQKQAAIARLQLWREKVDKTRFRNGMGTNEFPDNPESVSPVG